EISSNVSCPLCPTSHLLWMFQRPLCTSIFPYTTLFRSDGHRVAGHIGFPSCRAPRGSSERFRLCGCGAFDRRDLCGDVGRNRSLDRKITRLNSSHMAISYAVFCL